MYSVHDVSQIKINVLISRINDKTRFFIVLIYGLRGRSLPQIVGFPFLGTSFCLFLQY